MEPSTLQKLVGSMGCAADGTAAARNPLARLIDTMVEAPQVSDDDR